jgi:hypothetical protein
MQTAPADAGKASPFNFKFNELQKDSPTAAFFFMAFTRKVLLRRVLMPRTQRFRRGAQRDFDYLLYLSIFLERTSERRVKSTSFIMEHSIAKTL